MDKIIKFFTLAVMILCSQTACHLFVDNKEMDTVAVYFNESNVTVFEGGLGSATLRVDPTDALIFGNVQYEIGNEDVAAIYKADKRSCVFLGMKKGSTVLTARLRAVGGVGSAEAKMVVTVLPK